MAETTVGDRDAAHRSGRTAGTGQVAGTGPAAGTGELVGTGAHLDRAGSGPDDLAGRGRTVVADRVVERLARRFTLEVPGVVRQSTGPDLVSALTPDLPKVSVESAGDRVRLDLRIAVAWEHEARAVASAVQRSVRRRVVEATGKAVDRVDVTVVALVPASGRPSERRRVE